MLKSAPEPPTRLAMLKNQEADVAYGLFGPLAEEVHHDPSLQLEPVTPAGTVAQERLNCLYVGSTFTLLGFCVLFIWFGSSAGSRRMPMYRCSMPSPSVSTKPPRRWGHSSKEGPKEARGQNVEESVA